MAVLFIIAMPVLLMLLSKSF